MVEYRSSEELLPPRIMYETASDYSSRLRACRSIWLSDFHLGTHGCRADALLDFLRNHEAENLLPRGRHRRWLEGRSVVVLERCAKVRS